MSEILTNNKYYKDIADTIRQMKGVATTYKPREMAGALRDMYSTEVESVPPLTFPSNGNNLLNYRIDGANGGVGDLVTDTSDENYGKYKIPAVISGKNLWNDNITFENGTINQNTGADSSYASDYRIRSNFTDYIEPGQYTLNLAGVDRINTIALYSEKNIESFVESIVSTSGIPKTFSLQTGGYIRVALSKVNGDVVTPSDISNIQLEEGSIATDYEPYIEPTTTNIYLDEPIGANESKSLSDTNVNIPTINGTNILSIDTTVQPSNVYVQAPKTNNYNL